MFEKRTPNLAVYPDAGSIAPWSHDHSRAPVTSTIDAIGEQVARVCAAEPDAFRPEEVDDFVAFVVAGGEVTVHGLKERVMRAVQIAFLRDNDCLLGVGGLKNPSPHHRTEVEGGSKTKLHAAEVPFELGWVFILPSARNRKLSFPLCRALVSAANGKGIFATSRTNNPGMHRTLEKLRFVRVGTEWSSQQSDGNLALFIRKASS